MRGWVYTIPPPLCVTLLDYSGYFSQEGIDATTSLTLLLVTQK